MDCGTWIGGISLVGIFGVQVGKIMILNGICKKKLNVDAVTFPVKGSTVMAFNGKMA